MCREEGGEDEGRGGREQREVWGYGRDYIIVIGQILYLIYVIYLL